MTQTGKRTKYVGWEDVTSGAAKYTGDLTLPGMLVARILRSPVPFGRIVKLDCEPARDLPGVRGVVTASDLPTDRLYIHAGAPYSDRPPLAKSHVLFVGQEIAAVAADTAESADAALRAIRLKIRTARAPLETHAALAGRGASLHRRAEGRAKNVSVDAHEVWGDDSGLDLESMVSAAGKFTYPQVAHACMETNKTLASWDETRAELHMWTSTQAPWFVQHECAAILGLDTNQVILHDVRVGGGFGSKSKICDHEVLAGLLSMKTGRPVMLELSRDEEFTATKSRHGFSVGLRAYADQDGRLKLFDADVVVDNGAFNHYGPFVMKAGVKTLGIMYDLAAVRWRSRLVDTAHVPGAQFRGYGKPQVVFAIESLVDELAAQLNIDPIDFRLQNILSENTVALSGAHITSFKLADCLRAVRAALDWDAKKGDSAWKEPAPHIRRGLGVAVAVQGGAVYQFGDSNESASAVDLFADGRIRVRYASQDAGTGQRTILAQCAAEELGVGLDQVEVVLGETATSPVDMGAWSSRGTHMGLHATRMAAGELRRALLAAAGQKLGTSELTVAGGAIHGAGSVIGLGDLAPALDGFHDDLVSREATYRDPLMEKAGPNGRSNLSPSYPCAAHGVEVEVDTSTGETNVVHYVAAHDVGTAINPAAVEGQVIGAAAMGIGAALGEELIFSEGRVVNGSYIDYALPRAADLPDIDVVLVESSDDGGPYGAKGVGEIGIIPPGPAIANAVRDAIGLRAHELPITPDKIIRALDDGRRRHRYHIWRRPGRWEIAAARRLYPLGLHWLLETFGKHLPPYPPVVAPEVVRAASPDELAEALRAGATAIGGGTDAIVLQERGFTTHPRLVSTRFAGSLAETISTPEQIVLGAGVTLAAAAEFLDAEIRGTGEAIRKIATPQIREMATVGGNLLQAKRCWFYRSGINCYKRGGPTRPCYAVLGDHRFYHAAIGAHRCQAVTPSDLATILLSLDATVSVRRADGRTDRLPICEFYVGPGESCLRPGDFLAAVSVPRSPANRALSFDKIRLWTGDFAIVSVALATEISPGSYWSNTRLVFGGLASAPFRVPQLEQLLDRGERGQDKTGPLLNSVFAAKAHPLARNGWKLDAGIGLMQRVVRDLGNASSTVR